LERAQAAIDRAGGSKERARGQLYSVTVDLAPIASTMRGLAADRFRWAGYPEGAAAAKRLADDLASLGAVSPSKAQQVLWA
jgi:hypothetical protein